MEWLSIFTFVSFFYAKKHACGPEGRVLLNSEFGIRNVEFGIFIPFFPFRIPQSAFRNLVAGPWAIHRIAPTRI